MDQIFLNVLLLSLEITDIKKKEVKTDVAKEWAKSRGYMFYEGSAKSGGNVNEAFKKLFEEMFQKTIENRAKYIY